MAKIPILYDSSKRLGGWKAVKDYSIESTKCGKCDGDIKRYYNGVKVTTKDSEYSSLCAYCYDELYDQDEESSIEIAPYIDTSKGLMILDTGNNKAKHFFEFMDDNGLHNPYYYYCFWKEVSRKFINLKTLEDYFYKLDDRGERVPRVSIR